MLTSKRNQVKLSLQFKYRKPYKDYKRNTIINGPNVFLAGMNKGIDNSTYYKETKNGKAVPVMLVYTKTIRNDLKIWSIKINGEKKQPIIELNIKKVLYERCTGYL